MSQNEENDILKLLMEHHKSVITLLQENNLLLKQQNKLISDALSILKIIKGNTR